MRWRVILLSKSHPLAVGYARMTVTFRFLLTVVVAALLAALAHAQIPDTSQPASRCRIQGSVTSGNSPLPGVSIVVHVDSVLKAATSTDLDGKYTILFAPNATYHLSADLTAFSGVERDLTLASLPCH